jgi:hypothetical protein
VRLRVGFIVYTTVSTVVRLRVDILCSPLSTSQPSRLSYIL